MKRWLEAFRLRTLPLALSSIILGGMLAYSYGKFSWSILGLASLTTTLLQILSNLANDYGDSVSGVDNAERQGPQRTVQSGAITKSDMKRAIVICSILAFLSGIGLLLFSIETIGWQKAGIFFALGLLSILAAIKYTAGKNPYGYAGLGDLSVFLFFGLLGVLGSFYLHTGTFIVELILPAISIGLLSTAVLNLNNLRDHANDAKHGKRTLVVRIGSNPAKVYHTILVGGAVLSAVLFTLLNYYSNFQWIYLVILPILISNLRIVWKHKNPKTLDPELKKVALTTLIFSITFGLGLIIENV